MLLVGFKYYLSVKCKLTNGSMENGKSALKLQWHDRLRLQKDSGPISATC